jgi:hypothetical protein
MEETKTMKIRWMIGTAVAVIVFGGATHVAARACSADAGGYGFCGKGDVQLVFGWNNKALQENASQVNFRVSSPDPAGSRSG